MEYSNYTITQILENRGYREICNIFLELANDIETKSKLEDILYKGGYQEYSINSSIVSKDNPSIEVKRRISMAYLLLRNPETFNRLVENKVNLFHGTNANSLPNILKYGLNSLKESQKEGITVTTGETWSRTNNTRDFVSFTDVLDIAESYSCITPEEENQNLSFSVIIGTSVEDILQVGKYRVLSDIPEVGVKHKLPLENIKTISVPSDKVEFVKKLVNNKEIEVLAIDDIERKFYYMDDFGIIHINNDLLNEFKNNIVKQNNNKTFKLEEIEKVTLNRMLSNMKKQLKKVISTMSGGKEIEHDGRKIK